MKVPVSWLREFADLPDDAAEVGRRLGACGFAVDGLEGDVLDLDVTANRPDGLSVYGLAREAAAAFGVPLKPAPGTTALARKPAGHEKLPVSIGDAGCGRYVLALADVQVAPSPVWLADRLAAAGVRPINNVVDVTNYVMLETGQPLHAFDAAHLGGPEIRVRRARPGETLETLDGQARQLEETMLVIADRERPVALAGLMGGATSEVSRETRRIALESAWFRPTVVRAASKRLGLKTEASARFERGADLDAPARAAARALELLDDIGAGRAAGPLVDVQPLAVERRTVTLRTDRLARLLGDTVPAADVERILGALGFLPRAAAGGWDVTVPSWRVDVSREADLIEEVGRHWGFDRIPATFPALRAMPRPSAPPVLRARVLRRVLCGAGLQEAVTFTFIEDAAAAPFAAEADRVAILNPISEKFGVLRPSLLPGLLDSLVYSRHRESADVRLFEIGTAFVRAGEQARAGWVLTGSRGSHWSGEAGPVTFADARGVAELLAATFGVALAVTPADDLPWFARGRAARLAIGGRPAGWIGELPSAYVEARGLGPSDRVFAGEIDLAVLAPDGAPTARAIEPLPRFPSIVRDLSILVDERLPAASVRDTIRSHAPATLVGVREFDRYQGKGVPGGQISLSVRLTFRAPDRTLTDSEVQQAVDAIVAALARDHGAVLRGTAGPGTAE
ncbi:MAG: phenylalanine--tRNA ligase subunit beta [Vicinamibacterales bacterium]